MISYVNISKLCHFDLHCDLWSCYVETHNFFQYIFNYSSSAKDNEKQNPKWERAVVKQGTETNKYLGVIMCHILQFI